MIVNCVTIFVEEGRVDDFIAATVRNHEGSIGEPGNMRFDVLQSIDDPARFLLYEAYESEEAAKAHKETEHYREWSSTVADWMERPREGIGYRVIRPAERSQW